MCSDCLPLSVLQDQRYRELPAKMRNHAVDMCADLKRLPEGELTDAQLCANRVGPKGKEKIFSTFLKARWWRRKVVRLDDGTEEERIALSGELNPETVHKRALRAGESSGTAEPSLLDLQAQIKALDRKMTGYMATGSAKNSPTNAGQSTDTEPRTANMPPHAATTGSGQTADSDPEREGGSHLNSNSNGNSNSTDRSVENSNSEFQNSEGPGTAPQTDTGQRPDAPPQFTTAIEPRTYFDPPNRMSPLPDRTTVFAALTDLGLNESEANHAIKSNSIADIVAGVDCLQRGYFTKSTSTPGTLKNLLIHKKMKLHSRYIRDHIQPLLPRQEAAVMSVDCEAPEEKEAEIIRRNQERRAKLEEDLRVQEERERKRKEEEAREDAERRQIFSDTKKRIDPLHASG